MNLNIISYHLHDFHFNCETICIRVTLILKLDFSTVELCKKRGWNNKEPK